MLDYIKGTIVDISPTHVVLDNNGIGYFVNISINTYSNLSGKESSLLYIHEVIREDAHQLYGFSDKDERSIFLHLISVNGVGANTARVMLSSLSPSEIVSAISHNDINLLKSIKGIGAKTAERIIVDLRDKVAKIAEGDQIVAPMDNTIKDEALSALVMLGFPKSKVEKVLNSILKQKSDYSVEGLIKEALKRI
ncbi:MAG: Holliday junction branch migration protein RuvA [Bacteroidetes bacterium]|nr:Holliday junction branch migration protein RuvA [Bacteroidota bacterium]